MGEVGNRIDEGVSTAKFLRWGEWDLGHRGRVASVINTASSSAIAVGRAEYKVPEAGG